jgi:hypothetical protein
VTTVNVENPSIENCGSRHSEIFPQHGKLDPPKGITSLWDSEMQKRGIPWKKGIE